jgi:hypothetical protein
MSQALPDQAMYQFFLGQSLPSFDQIVKGNVNIKKLSKYRYRITFSKIGKFLMYQVWDKDDVNKMNAKRQVQYVSAKEWVKSFKERNSNNFLDVKTLFTPTTIMETENRVYAFVIHTVDLNSCDKVVFTVSTKEISHQNNTSKKLIQLPEGKCNDVRFDIDNSIFPFPPLDDWISCINNKIAEEISKNYKFSITFSDTDRYYERYTVNGNITLETLKTFLFYSEMIENTNLNPNDDNRYFLNGLKSGKYTTGTILLSKGVGVVVSDSDDFDGYFAIEKGIVQYFLILKSIFDNDNTIPKFFNSISFINTQNIVCPSF